MSELNGFPKFELGYRVELSHIIQIAIFFVGIVWAASMYAGQITQVKNDVAGFHADVSAKLASIQTSLDLLPDVRADVKQLDKHADTTDNRINAQTDRINKLDSESILSLARTDSLTTQIQENNKKVADLTQLISDLKVTKGH